METFVPKVLRIDGAAAQAVAKLLAKKKADAAALREDILQALSKELSPGAAPEWVVFAVGGTLEGLLHLAPPMFRTSSADADEFFGDVGARVLVYTREGEAWRGEKAVTVTAEDIPKVRAYKTAGEVVLTDIAWLEAAPRTRARFHALMRAADDAFHGELEAYDLNDLRPAAAPGSRAAAAPAVASGEAPGVGGAFLGGAARASYDPSPGPRAPKIAWSAEGCDGDEWGGFPVSADGFVFAGSGGFSATFSCVDAKTGAVVWTRKMSTTQSWPANSACVHRGVLYMATNHGLYALDAATGKDRWMAKAGGISGSAVIAGELCVVALKKSLDAHALDTGRRKWSHKVDNVWSSPAWRDGVLFVRAGKALFALDATDGKKALWQTPTWPYGPSGPTLLGDLVLHKNERDAIAAHDVATGARRWAAGAAFADAALAAGGGRVVATDRAGHVHALDAATGEPVWRFDPKVEAYAVASPAIAGDVVVLATSGALLGLDLGSGRELWRMKPAAKIGWRTKSTPAVRDGVVYVQEYSRLHALRDG